MVDITNVIKGNSRQINMDKLADLCRKKNVSDHFKMSKEDFFDLSNSNQRQLTSKFYFDNVDNQPSIDESISDIIKNSDGVNWTKIIDNENNRTQMSISTEKMQDEKKPKSTTMWKNDRFFQGDCGNFKLEKVNLPKNALFYVNQGYLSYKDSKKCYYNDIYAIAQIMPLAHQPKDVDSYKSREDEVKILWSLYDRENGKFWGIEYCVGLMTVRDDPDEQFFDYGYVNVDSKNLYCTVKTKIPSSFKATCFGSLKNQFDGGVFTEQDHSEVFFYLPSTVDRSEEINKYMTCVHLKPFSVSIRELGEDFNPAQSLDRAQVVNFMKKVAERSSQN